MVVTPAHLLVVKYEPLNAEVPPPLLVDEVTPVDTFYLRTHLTPPPTESMSTWTLTVGGAVREPLTLNLDELRALGPARTIVTTMECAGNNRTMHAPLPPGEPWVAGAVSTARWTGLPLRTVLERAGLQADTTREVLAGGADQGQPEDADAPLHYERSLSLDEVFGRSDDDAPLLVWAMNDTPLPHEHGGPLRLVVPRWYGMANVKWLNRLDVLTEPFRGYYQRRRYIYDYADGSEPIPLSTMRVKALISAPSEDAVLRVGDAVSVRGWAWSGDGPIERVEVATRGGDAWAPATLSGPGRAGVWQAWEYTWRPEAPGRHPLRVRASDSAGNSQPEIARWNRFGYGANGIRPYVVTVRPAHATQS